MSSTDSIGEAVRQETAEPPHAPREPLDPLGLHESQDLVADRTVQHFPGRLAALPDEGQLRDGEGRLDRGGESGAHHDHVELAEANLGHHFELPAELSVREDLDVDLAVRELLGHRGQLGRALTGDRLDGGDVADAKLHARLRRGQLGPAENGCRGHRDRRPLETSRHYGFLPGALNRPASGPRPCPDAAPEPCRTFPPGRNLLPNRRKRHRPEYSRVPTGGYTIRTGRGRRDRRDRRETAARGSPARPRKGANPPPPPASRAGRETGAVPRAAPARDRGSARFRQRPRMNEEPSNAHE